MSRVSYNRPLSQVGFRAMRATHPFQAAQMSGLSGLGDDSSVLASLGFSASQIAQITAAHNAGALSDNGYLFLTQGGVPVNSLNDFLAQDPGASDSGSPSSSAAGVPTGATITYQGQWDSSALTRSPQDVLNLVLQKLGQYGLQVVSSQAQASASALLKAATITDLFFGVTIAVRITGPGFTQANDVAAIIDHEAYAATGHMPVTSSAAVTSLPGGAGAALPGTDLSSFLQNNLSMILLGVAAIVVLPALVKKL